MHGLIWAGVALLILWAVLWLAFHVVSGIVHLLVVAAVIMIVWGFMKRGAAAVTGS